MALDPETGTRLSLDLVRVVKLLQALKSTAPRHHERVEQTSYPILFTLSREPARITRIAEHVHSDVSVVSRQVTALEGHGLVTRSPDPEDRRASLVRLTADGEELVAEALAGRGRWFAGMLPDWTEEEAEVLHAGLERLTRDLTRALDETEY